MNLRMNRKHSLILILVILFLYYIIINRRHGSLIRFIQSIVLVETTELDNPRYLEQSPSYREPEMAVAVVSCGDRWQETLVMIKSALLFTFLPLKFFILTEDEYILNFEEKLSDWLKTSNRSFTYEVLPVKFPQGNLQNEWKKLFKPCASQRLFLPNVLENVDSVLYVDTDTLFLGPVNQLWEHFHRMNSTQFAALAPEHEDPNNGWYNRFARHPFYEPLGVNTGVMLMNLTRMRQFGLDRYVIPIYKMYKLKITYGDQDIINILFHFHPDRLYIYSCRYNYRADHCMYVSNCKDAEKEGIVVLHGSRGIFHVDKHPPFRDVYKAMEEYQWNTNPYTNFYLVLKSYLDTSRNSNCGSIKSAFTKNVERYIGNFKYDK